MATPRAAKDLAEFINPKTIGAAIFGLIADQGENGNGRFVTFAPAMWRAGPSDKFTRYTELACGLSTDLATKVGDTDTGKYLLFVFVATKPTNKQPMKIYNVIELTRDEVAELAKTGKLAPEWTKAPEVAVTGKAKAVAQDDLPF